MARNTFNDSSRGDVVITPGSSGFDTGGGGFFSIGGGGGFGGGFSSSSRRRAKKRARARAIALAQAKAEEQARQAAAARARAEALAKAHRQRVDTHGKAREARRAQLDAHFAGLKRGLAQALSQEIDAARTRPVHDPSERWQLYQITKARNETLGLIAAKQRELAGRKTQAAKFAGHDMAAQAYVARLMGLSTIPQMQQLHRDWEAAYVASQQAALLQEAIQQLSERAAALLAEHGQKTQLWRESDAKWAREREYAQQREARIRYKQQVDEDCRLKRLRQAATLTAPVAAAQSGGVLLTQAGAQVAADLAGAIEQAIANAAKELLRVAAIRVGQAVSLTTTAMLYAPELGNGELTDAQRRRHLEGLGVRADLLGVQAGQDLQAIADAGGSARLDHRIKIEPVAGGSGVALVSTGTGVAYDVPVRNAVFDPLTDTYRVEAEGPLGKSIVLGSTATPTASPGQGGVLALETDAVEIGAGVDLRFDDCIVCIPGQPPQYFSFTVSPAGTGVVNGKGQVATAKWWAGRDADTGAGIPAQVGDQLRGRVFTGQPAFENAVWRAIAAEEALLGQFDELNQRRMLHGYPPVAPRATWNGTRHEFELRHAANPGVGSGLYDLDQLRIHHPGATQGILTSVQPFQPWFSSSVAMAFDPAIVQGQPPRTWTPVAAPGADLLGPTVLPEAPSIPGVLPGSPAEPVLPAIETFPGENPGETGAIIPGFGEDQDLPQPGLVNYEPAEPLEVGEYKDLSRRSINYAMDVDHIVSRRAYQIFLMKTNQKIDARALKDALMTAPSIVIPAAVHRKYSETYGGRNSPGKQSRDASDLRQAVDSNLDALKSGLLEYGFTEQAIESARQKLHALHEQKGLYR